MKLRAITFCFLIGFLSITRADATASTSSHLTSSYGTVWQEIAQSSLRSNIVSLQSGQYLVAGQHQFRTLWTRDFCSSIRGLLSMGETEVVRNHLGVLMDQRRYPDGLISRVMDSIPIQLRVIIDSVFAFIRFPLGIPIEDPLKAQFKDEHGSEAIDSNALVLLGALDYFEQTQDQAWWDVHKQELVEIFHFYQLHLNSQGLLTQQQFSDWQDSVSRQGVTSYANLLYVLLLRRLAHYAEFQIPSDQWLTQREVFIQTFYDAQSGLFRSIQNEPYFSLDTQLLAIDRDLFSDAPELAQDLYLSLKRSPLWNGPAGIPGFVTTPDYPASWVTQTVKWAGLEHYHDEVYWSWLIALSAKVSLKQGDIDEARRITTELARVIERDGVVAEIFFPTPKLALWEKPIYKAETPFSWGSALTVELAITELKQGINWPVRGSHPSVELQPAPRTSQSSPESAESPNDARN